jgi:hypothetical protein
VKAIGVDEIQWKFGQTYLTLVYQIDVGVRRLIWVGEHRTLQTINAFFTWFGADRVAGLRADLRAGSSIPAGWQSHPAYSILGIKWRTAR